jgi:hypothetical protein
MQMVNSSDITWKARLSRATLGLGREPAIPFLLMVVFGAIVMGMFSLTLPTPDPMAPDSPTYLDFSPKRTLGYPLILAAVGHFDPSLRILPFLQMLALILSAAALMEACNRLYPAGMVWIFTGVVGLLNPFLWRYTMMVLTESTYASLCMLVLASFFVAILHRPRGTAWLITTGALIGLAISVKPSAYAVLIAVGIGTAFWKTRVARAFAALAAPALACVLALSTWNWAERGIFGTQLAGGTEILGNVALLIPPDLPGKNHEIAAQIAADLTPVSSRLPGSLTSIRDARDYYWVTYESLGPLRDEIVEKLTNVVLDRAKASGETLNTTTTGLRVNELAWNITRDTILDRPLAYFRNALIHFVALWTFPEIATHQEETHVRSLLCDGKFVWFSCASEGGGVAVRIFVPRAVSIAKDAVMTTAMLLSIALPFFIAFRRSDSLLGCAMAVTALCINGNFAIAALVEAGIPRYAIPMWPLVCIMIAGTGLLVFEDIRTPVISASSGKRR